MTTTTISTVQGTKIKRELTGLKSALSTAFSQYNVKSLIGKRKREFSKLTTKKVKVFLSSIDAETELAENIAALHKVLAIRQRTTKNGATSEAVKEFKLAAGKTLIEIKTLATCLLTSTKTPILTKDIFILSNTALVIKTFFKNPTSKTNLKKLVIQGEIISKKTGAMWANLKLTYTAVVGIACIVAGVSSRSGTAASMAAIGTGYTLLHGPILGAKNGASHKKARATAIANKMQSLMKRIKILLAFQTVAKTRRATTTRQRSLSTNQGETLLQRFTFSGR